MREKERLHYLAQFPPFPTVNEGQVAKSKESVPSDSDTIDKLTSISKSTTEDSSSIFTIETTSTFKEYSSAPSVYQNRIQKKIENKHVLQNILWIQSPSFRR